MKFAIIGAGNMGGALARGLAGNGLTIAVSNPSKPKLLALKQEFPAITISNDNSEVVADADIIILAIKPWLVKTVIEQIAPAVDFARQTIVSLAAGISLSDLAEMLKPYTPTPMLARVMPNIAIEYAQSMTFITFNDNVPYEAWTALHDGLEAVGKVAVVDEKQFVAAMALCSCGIAYVLRYIRASVEGAVELGVRPADAAKWVAQTMVGATAYVMNDIHPEVAIDKVTTPGGVTIKGLNAMEANGFTTAVIEGLKASVK
jgi:pyrroline-5-carboxylate reductase